jgi:putative oxidoreductase
MKRLFIPNINLLTSSNRVSTALLAIRLIVGIAFVLHGLGKITSAFSWMGPEAPVPGALQALAAFAEFGGGISFIIGLLTPISSIGLMITMAVAISFHVSKGDGFVQGFELAAVYFIMAFSILLAGPGKFSLDSVIAKRSAK